MNKRIIIIILAFLFSNYIVKAQISLSDNYKVDYTNPQEFEIGGITVTGAQFLDNNALTLISGLSVGEKIKVPSDKISKAINNLWKQGLFSDVSIKITKIYNGLIFFDISLKERPRLSKFSFNGVKKAEADNLRDEIKLTKGDVVTENLILNSESKVRNYLIGKGYLNNEVQITQKNDTAITNSVILNINIKKNGKVKVNDIIIEGNNDLLKRKIYHAMKNTKKKHWWNIFKKSKYIEKDYKEDKGKIIDKYNTLGFRDARIISDSIYKNDAKTINIKIKVSEGHKYYFRNITWVGNTKYTDKQLAEVLKIKKGDIYNQAVLDANLFMSQESTDISSLYMDDGYLFFSVTPTEINVENDSIDLEMRIYEGRQATINKVTIVGNTKTRDHVILREIRTKPGQLFSRSDIIRSQRELAQLRYFNAEKLNVTPKPNQADGTVDIEYTVEETSSDQVELSGGWGAGRVVGTLGVSFNNFSARNIFKKNAWAPLPSGDGQMLSMRAQSNGLYYQSYNASFTEPWLGGKKPNALSVSLYHSVQTNGLTRKEVGRESIFINGLTIGLGRRLTWPDDYFTLYQDISFQNYLLNNWGYTFMFQNGRANNISYSISFGRNSVDQPIYARSGSLVNIRLQATPPYSLLNNKDYGKMEASEKYKWIEYHKWKFNSSWFTSLAGNLVLNTRCQFGYLGHYNSTIGTSPFGRFYVGGDGLTGYALDDREVVAMRGYANQSLTPANGASIYDKYTIELRYPISLNPMATVYVLGFAEGGNAWTRFDSFNPFEFKRSAGAGVRIFLPMFGLLGLDWGYGFDEIPGAPSANKGQFHFSIGQSID
ncbi:MAG: outer membrane protein assembly factor BamA [Bacteroidota bacterium]